MSQEEEVVIRNNQSEVLIQDNYQEIESQVDAGEMPLEQEVIQEDDQN